MDELPVRSLVHCPTTVCAVVIPAISRTQLLFESAMKRLPFLSKARPEGRSERDRAGDSRAEGIGASGESWPATAQMVVAGSVARWRTTWLIGNGIQRVDDGDV